MQKNDMEIAADGNKLSVRFVSGMVEATGVEPVLSALFSSNILIFHLFFICLQTFLIDLQLPHRIASSAKG